MRVLNRKTQVLLPDEFDWLALFTQFRDNPRLPHVSRVMHILKLLKDYEQELKRKGPKRIRLHGELNRLVGAYEWRSNVSPSSEGLIEILRPPFEVTEAMRWEYLSVRWLLDLLNSRGGLDHVHLCEMHEKRPDCAGWYYGRPNKGVCSGACKQYRYDSNDAVKARKARNAKDNLAYRLSLQKQERKAKDAVGFKGSYRLRARKAGGVKKGEKVQTTVRVKEPR